MLRLLRSIILLVCLHLPFAAAAHAQGRQQGSVCRAAASLADHGEYITISSSFILDDGWHLSRDTIVVEECSGLTPGSGSSKGCLRMQKDREDYTVRGYIQYVVCSDVSCLAPKYVEFSYHGKAGDTAPAAPASTDDTPIREEKTDSVMTIGKEAAALSAATEQADTSVLWSYIAPPDTAAATDSQADRGLATLFLFAFLGGLLSLLTPCIWPVVPMTMSFFMKKKGGARDALLFGACIIGTYLIFGILITIAFGADAMNGIATNAVFNIVCFTALVLLGASMLGLFTLQLPSTWSDRLDSLSLRTTGMVSIFLMSLTLVVVSFSCTAPVVGMLLVQVASDGDLLSPVVGMAGYAMALALPFTLFALFPGMAKRLPKSGSWMQHVKVTLGIFEIAFAMKFLSIADQTNGWGIMPRSIFFAVWTILAAALAIYFFLRVSKAASAAPLAIAAYLATGIFGAPCTLVSAFAPQDESAFAASAIFHDYEEGIVAAREAGKPVFLEFTGYGCVNCRKMEGAVFSDAGVQQMLREDFVWIKLYVDDRTASPEKGYRTIGDKWSHLEMVKFHEQSQPYYIVMDAGGHPLISPYHYNEDIAAFKAWLQKARGNFLTVPLN